jgi:hypothetical protein
MSLIPWLIAIPITALLMGGWRRIFRVIFKDRSSELSTGMLQLTVVARFMVWHAVVATYGVAEVNDQTDEHAGDIVKYLFNDSEGDEDKADRFRAATDVEAMLWLDANQDWQELVVQTLKVQMISASDRGDIYPDDLDNLIKAPVFEKYGRDYAMKVDPRSYTQLVDGKLKELPESLRDLIRQRFQV